ncbi:MFS transporter [Risungbinella massiliensis]|uniref:MFS transporter n=1 Tax=Risungbinella massiliensis TaxID=1329796 RepID=UPI0005CC63B0|nr:MFS transporter [Risungbinella massiliensis]
MIGAKLMKSWKYPFILLFGIGVSNLGEWIYFIALNLMVLDMSGSPFAVSALYIIKPLASLFTNSWSGSMIDRFNKRNLMVLLDLFRAIWIVFLPFVTSIWSIYCIVFVINMASSMFRPASTAYITKLIPSDQRKRYNSLLSVIQSGAFLIGPAIAGILFLTGSPILAIYVNAISLFVSGIITLFMPDLEKQTLTNHTSHTKISWKLLKKDWLLVWNFSRKSPYIMFIYFLFSCVIVVMATALDSLEAAFAKEVLHLSDSDYGFLVSIAGVGIAAGAMVNTLVVTKIETSWLIGFGSVFVSVGYIIYAFSNSFFIAAFGFFILAFFLAFANTGFLTFYQNNIPVDVMGRVGSIYGWIEALFIIITTIIVGLSTELIGIQIVVIVGTLVMLLLAITLCIFNFQPSKARYYQPTKDA